MRTVIDFLVASLNPIYLITFIVALLCYGKYKSGPLKLFPLFLMATLLIELLGYIATHFFGWKNNLIIYNIYHLLYFPFLYFLVYQNIVSLKKRKIIELFAFIYGISVLCNLMFQDFFLESQLLSYIVGGLLLIISITLYYADLLEKGEIHQIKRDLFFWITAGILIFFVGYLPIKAGRTLVFDTNTSTTVKVLLRLIHLSLIILMNVFFIIGFLWAKKKS